MIGARSILSVCLIAGLAAEAAAQCTMLAPRYVVRVANTVRGRGMECTDYGTGTVVADDGRRSVVVTCWHLVRDGTGRIVIYTPAGVIPAEVILADRPADLLALSAPSLGIRPAAIGETYARPGESVSSGGFGPNARYQACAGEVIGYRRDETGGNNTICFRGAARDGDSGGPIFDLRGQLIGVLCGTDGQRRYGSAFPVLRAFLDRVLSDWRPRILPGPVEVPADPGAVAGPPPIPIPSQPGSTITPNPPLNLEDLPAVSAPIAIGPAVSPPAASVPGSGLPLPLPPAPAAEALPAAQSPADPVSHDWAGLAFGAATTAAPWILGILGVSTGAAVPIGGAWLAVKAASALLAARRRRRAKGGQAAPAEPFSAATCWPRDTTEAKQLLRLSQREGRAPLLDALFGRLADDELANIVDGSADQSEKNWAAQLKAKLTERFNEMAPLAIVTREGN